MENPKKLLLTIALNATSAHLERVQRAAVEIIASTEASDSSSDSEDDDYILFSQTIIDSPNRIKGFVERVVKHHSHTEFQHHFRLTKEAFDFLLRKVQANIEERDYGRPMIGIEKQLLAIVWLLANQECYRSVVDRFDLPKSTLSQTFFRIINAINKIAAEIIRWPTETEMTISKLKFQNISGIKNCIGAIDGTYVAIKAPKDQSHCYTNRKKFHSVTLQAVSDHQMRFIDCSAGYPSSMHDARIFKKSQLYQKANQAVDTMFSGNNVILGDKAYPITRWCIPPYIDNGRLSDVQKKFNKAHSSARQVVERSFALLFGRWRRLKMLDMNRVEAIPATILACCVMHNICLLFPDESVDSYIAEGVNNAFENDTGYDIFNVGENANGAALRDFMALELSEH